MSETTGAGAVPTHVLGPDGLTLNRKDRVSGRLDYAKQKRRDAGRNGEPADPRERFETGNWRVEYPEEFPVIVGSLGDQPKIPRQTGHRHRRRTR